MAQLIQQCTEAEAIAQQDELVLELGALLSRAREVLDRSQPLVVCRLRLARERVQVVDERREELQRARVRAELIVQPINMVCDRVRRALLWVRRWISWRSETERRLSVLESLSRGGDLWVSR